jgi:hypothetical protein
MRKDVRAGIRASCAAGGDGSLGRELESGSDAFKRTCAARPSARLSCVRGRLRIWPSSERLREA